MDTKLGTKKLPRNKQILRNKIMIALQAGDLIHVRDLEAVFYAIELFLILPFDLAVVVVSSDKLRKVVAAYKRTKLDLLIDFIVHEQVKVYAAKTQAPQIILVDDYDKYKPPKEWKSVTTITTGNVTATAKCVT